MLPEFSDVAFGLGSLWIVNRAANSVVEVDPLTNQKQRDITVSGAPAAIAVGDKTLWVANFEDDTVTRIAVPGPGQTDVSRPLSPSATARSTSRWARAAYGSRTSSTTP